MRTKKTKNANYLKLGFFLFGISLLLWNCEKQELLSEEPIIVNTIAKISSVFNKEQFKEVIPYQFTVNWQNNGIKYSKELETSYYEFNLSYTSSLTPYINIANKKIGDYYKSFKIVATVNNEKEFVSFYALRVYQKIQQTGEPIAKINFESATNFNGIIHVINIHNEIVFAKKFEQGKTQGKDYFSKEFKHLDPYKSRERQVCITVYIKHYEDRYNVDDTGKRYYMGTNYLGKSKETICAYEYLPDYGGYTGGNGNGSEGANGPGAGTYRSDCSSSRKKNKNKLFAREPEECATKITEKVEEGCQKGYVLNDEKKCVKEVQIFNNLTGKARCIYGKLENSSTDFKNMIKKFDGNFPVSHLKFILEDLGNTRGQTRAPNGAGNSPDYVITIALNSNLNIYGVNYRPKLMTAKTIAHEVIHAEMFRKLLSLLDNGGNLAGVTRQDILNKSGDFPGIYDYFRRHKNWQHQQMANHYRETIADILQNFDNNQHSRQFYMDSSWEGLIKSNISAWTSQTQLEKDRIKKVIKDYIEANKNQNCQ